jgi:hypothetical protein
MGQLVMSFRGLWIHVNPSSQGYNVSAVNATNGADYTPEGSVEIHLPAHFFSIEAGETVAGLLTEAGIPVSNMGVGWTLTVQNATGDLTVNLTGPGNDPVPSLTTYDTDMQLNPAEDWACVVGVGNGSITTGMFSPLGGNPGGGLYTTWTVQTNGDPVLAFTRPGESTPEVQIPSTAGGAELSNNVPGSLVLHNSTGISAEEEPDTSFDFALYYLAAVGGIPAKFAVPLPGSPILLPMPRLGGTSLAKINKWIEEMKVWLLENLLFMGMDLTSSCSNSQWP